MNSPYYLGKQILIQNRSLFLKLTLLRLTLCGIPLWLTLALALALQLLQLLLLRCVALPLSPPPLPHFAVCVAPATPDTPLLIGAAPSG